VNQSKANQFCRERANELLKMASALEDKQIVQDTSDLRSASNLCARMFKENGVYKWQYNIDSLIFNLLPFSHTKPTIAQKLPLKLDLSVKLKAKCFDEDDIEDPFEELTTNIYIVAEGLDSARDPEKKWICCWHLDKHQVSENSEESEEDDESDFAHPAYHFQHGGNKLKANNDFNFGQNLILDPPRIAHPPLDGILAIDFIVSNFLGPKWKKLQDSPEYYRPVASSQKLFWKPYLERVKAFWPRPNSENARLIWPQLLEDTY
jgi:hypothetical protein